MEPIPESAAHASSKGGFPHFMIKEIYEQPQAVRRTIAGCISEDEPCLSFEHFRIAPEELQGIRKIDIVAWGASRHAGLAGKHMIERLSPLTVEVDHAGEYRYRDPLVGPETLTLGITQSGETPDTVAALRQARGRGSRTIAITNVPRSAITREADGVIYTQAGPEVSVAATKSFTTQLAALFLFALHLAGVRRTLSPSETRSHFTALRELPAKLEAALACDHAAAQLAEEYARLQDFLLLGRGIHYPVALEGALKLKETSYLHAEGYPAGEMKHGPNALIDDNLLVVMLATRDPADAASMLRYEKTLANLKEVKEHGGRVLAIAHQEDTEMARAADRILYVPASSELLLPLLEIVPLQLLAYHLAVRRGADVDRPRNLAKFVTEE